MSNNISNRVIIPCRFSYLHCWEPDSVNGGDPKYSVSAIIQKNDAKTVNAIRKAIERAKQESMSKWGGKIPPNLKTPLRDGDIDRPDDEAYAGCYFLNANSRQAPQVVDANVQPILDQSEVYSGCYGKISVTFYGYNSNTAGKICYYIHKKADGRKLALYACYRKSDGVIGMYDVENNVFYTNNGSGDFAKGADI
jgi:hypothetical protein